MDNVRQLFYNRVQKTSPPKSTTTKSRITTACPLFVMFPSLSMCFGFESDDLGKVHCQVLL